MAFACSGGKDGSNKGIIDLFVFKKDMKQHMLGPLLECNPFPTEAKEQLRRIFESHKVYRQQYRPWENEDVDLTFTGSWTPSVRKFADLVERVVYGKEMDV